MPASLLGFSATDWTILLAYMLLVVAIGARAGRGRRGADEFFLAGRGMPVGAVAVSVLATSLSAATWVGGPELAYRTNLTYLSAQIGGLIAIVLVALLFVPAYYRLGVTSVYELLGERGGPVARRAASGMFMVGRLLASGARLFMVAIPFALITFGDLRPAALVASIVAIAAVATVYTLLGGIRAVIWTDVLQAVVLVVTVGLATWLLLRRIPLDAGEIVDVLANARPGGADGGSKLRILDLDRDPARWYTLWTALFGWSLFNLAAFGVDQDLVQRLLTCRSARAGQCSAILSIVLAWPVVTLFLILGLLLFIFYDRPDLLGDAAPGYAVDDSRRIFLEFVLHEIGPGLRGLMIAGLFAAAMSSLDSALNALASTTIADFYRPWKQAGGRLPAALRRERTASRLAVAAWALLLSLFAAGCVWWQQASGEALINFALGVMVFAYGGLLGVFLAVLLTSRGSGASVVAALATGFATVAILRSLPEGALGFDGALAMPWEMLISTALSFAVCCVGEQTSKRRNVETSKSER